MVCALCASGPSPTDTAGEWRRPLPLVRAPLPTDTAGEWRRPPAAAKGQAVRLGRHLRENRCPPLCAGIGLPLCSSGWVRSVPSFECRQWRGQRPWRQRRAGQSSDEERKEKGGEKEGQRQRDGEECVCVCIWVCVLACMRAGVVRQSSCPGVVRLSGRPVVQSSRGPVVQSANCLGVLWSSSRPVVQPTCSSRGPLVRLSSCPGVWGSRLSSGLEVPIVQLSSCPVFQLSGRPVVSESGSHSYPVIQVSGVFLVPGSGDLSCPVVQSFSCSVFCRSLPSIVQFSNRPVVQFGFQPLVLQLPGRPLVQSGSSRGLLSGSLFHTVAQSSGPPTAFARQGHLQPLLSQIVASESAPAIPALSSVNDCCAAGHRFHSSCPGRRSSVQLAATRPRALVVPRLLRRHQALPRPAAGDLAVL